MRTRSTVLIAFAGAAISLGGCNHTEASPEQRPAAARSAEKPETKYVGSWRDADGTIQIARDGAAFIVETEGPAGPKEVGTFENGVLRISSFSALYTASSDHLILNGHEYHRIEARKQTLDDLAAIGVAVKRYIAEGEYHIPPVNSSDFFFFGRKYFPQMPHEDGWGTPLRYLCKSGQSRWAVVSAGPDGVFEEVLTADMVADGMIGAGGDDIVMVDGVITSGLAPARNAAVK